MILSAAIALALGGGVVLAEVVDERAGAALGRGYRDGADQGLVDLARQGARPEGLVIVPSGFRNWAICAAPASTDDVPRGLMLEPSSGRVGDRRGSVPS